MSTKKDYVVSNDELRYDMSEGDNTLDFPWINDYTRSLAYQLTFVLVRVSETLVNVVEYEWKWPIICLKESGKVELERCFYVYTKRFLADSSGYPPSENNGLKDQRWWALISSLINFRTHFWLSINSLSNFPTTI